MYLNLLVITIAANLMLLPFSALGMNLEHTQRPALEKCLLLLENAIPFKRPSLRDLRIRLGERSVHFDAAYNTLVTTERLDARDLAHSEPQRASIYLEQILDYGTGPLQVPVTEVWDQLRNQGAKPTAIKAYASYPNRLYLVVQIHLEGNRAILDFRGRNTWEHGSFNLNKREVVEEVNSLAKLESLASQIRSGNLAMALFVEGGGEDY